MTPTATLSNVTVYNLGNRRRVALGTISSEDTKGRFTIGTNVQTSQIVRIDHQEDGSVLIITLNSVYRVPLGEFKEVTS